MNTIVFDFKADLKSEFDKGGVKEKAGGVKPWAPE
jgi:hypothetical protein